jgi:hypothetical protein
MHKYKHVQASSVEELDTKVQEMLDAGWTLCGAPYNIGTAFYQCVVVSSEESNNGLTVDDIATLSLLKGVTRGRRGLY